MISGSLANTGHLRSVQLTNLMIKAAAFFRLLRRPLSDLNIESSVVIVDLQNAGANVVKSLKLFLETLAVLVERGRRPDLQALQETKMTTKLQDVPLKDKKNRSA